MLTKLICFMRFFFLLGPSFINLFVQYSCTERSAAPQVTLWGRPAPGRDAYPRRADLVAGTPTTRPSHLPHEIFTSAVHQFNSNFVSQAKKKNIMRVNSISRVNTFKFFALYVYWLPWPVVNVWCVVHFGFMRKSWGKKSSFNALFHSWAHVR